VSREWSLAAAHDAIAAAVPERDLLAFGGVRRT
jgi:hypothetical protein